MKTMNFFRCAMPVFAAALLASCACENELGKQFDTDAPREQLTAVRTAGKITLDGNLNEAAWASAPSFHLRKAARLFGPIPPKMLDSFNRQVFQDTEVKLLYDNEYLYIGAKLDDSDVVQYGTKDQRHLYEQGDTFEIFIKSEKTPKYREFYVAPNGKKTTYVFLSRGYVRPDWGTLDPAFLTSVKVLGTLNDCTDKDDGWIVEAAIPFKMLEDFTGVKFASDGRWTILLARYNYNFGQEVRELSAAPQLPYDNFHLTEYYAELVFK